MRAKTCPICNLTPCETPAECEAEEASYRETQVSFIRDNSKGKT